MTKRLRVTMGNVRAAFWYTVLLVVGLMVACSQALHLWVMERCHKADLDPWLDEPLGEVELDAIAAAENDEGEPW